MLSLFIVLVSGSASVLAAPGLTVTFSGDKQVTNVDNFKVITTIKNTGDDTLNVLNSPNSVLAPDWATNVFNVEGDKSSALFNGIAVKYSPGIGAEQKLYTTLVPGQSVNFTHALSVSYDFATSGPGTYTISLTRLGRSVYNVANDGSIHRITLDDAHPHVATLAGSTGSSTESDNPHVRSIRAERVIKYVGCNTTQKADISAAAVLAQQYANNAWTFAKTVTSDNFPRYKTWFGVYKQSRRELVTNHFSNIRNGQIDSYIFDCSTCTRHDWFAYVDPNVFGKVFLCGAFWPAPAKGSDSKPGTIVHEASHFIRNGGTSDIAYGQADCKALAKSDPDSATTNADSHEYFAENTPPL